MKKLNLLSYKERMVFSMNSESEIAEKRNEWRELIKNNILLINPRMHFTKISEEENKEADKLYKELIYTYIINHCLLSANDETYIKALKNVKYYIKDCKSYVSQYIDCPVITELLKKLNQLVSEYHSKHNIQDDVNKFIKSKMSEVYDTEEDDSSEIIVINNENEVQLENSEADNIVSDTKDTQLIDNKVNTVIDVECYCESKSEKLMKKVEELFSIDICDDGARLLLSIDSNLLEKLDKNKEKIQELLKTDRAKRNKIIIEAILNDKDLCYGIYNNSLIKRLLVELYTNQLNETKNEAEESKKKNETKNEAEESKKKEETKKEKAKKNHQVNFSQNAAKEIINDNKIDKVKQLKNEIHDLKKKIQTIDVVDEILDYKTIGKKKLENLSLSTGMLKGVPVTDAEAKFVNYLRARRQNPEMVSSLLASGEIDTHLRRKEYENLKVLNEIVSKLALIKKEEEK